MDLAEYMELCLGHPEHGYYMTRDPLGAAGDFTTSPEISQMFGEMVGMWLADLWIKMGSPSEFALVECGPGRGTLMADIMRTTKGLAGFHEGAKLYLMEMSPVLRCAQQEKLGIYDPVWIRALSELPALVPVLLLGNEFLDALPVHQLVHNGQDWVERIIVLHDNATLGWGQKKADISLVNLVPYSVRANAGKGVSEVSPVINQYIKSVNKLLVNQNGVALFLDYGHLQSAMGETLQAVKKHRYVTIFDTPGHSDLTAHVDFENIEYLAAADGVRVYGGIEQGQFLKNLGIEMRAARLSDGATQAQSTDIATSLKRLIDTDQMGSLFKVMALCYHPDATFEPAGFDENI